MRGSIVLSLTVLFVLAVASVSDAQPRKLSDTELDRVTAGGVVTPQPAVPTRPPDDPVSFEFKSPAGARHTVEGTGTVQVLEGPDVKGSLVVRDNAQQNLQSLINVTAVNSRIQVLVNLNVAINSTIAAVNQVNASGGP